MAIRDKTQLKTQSLQRKALYKNNSHKNKFNPNYYPSVASVDNNSIELTCIFPETLNKMHNRMCGNNTSKQNNFLISNNTNKDIYQ